MDNSDPERMNCMEVWGGNRAVQRSFLTPGLKIFVYSRPYGQAKGGGDVYYLSSCASGRITRMLLADVSGHGEAVSQTAVGLRDLMRRNVNYVRQTRFVRTMNQQFSLLNQQGGFATALVGTFFASTKNYSLCNAGHPVPLVYRQASSQWSALKNLTDRSQAITDTPLGVAEEAAYGLLNTRLEIGDMVFSFSDAVIESLDSTGRQLGQSGVLQLVRQLSTEEPDNIIPTLMEHIHQLHKSNLHQDDVTFLLIQATGKGPSLKNNLLAPLRFWGKVTDQCAISSPST